MSVQTVLEYAATNACLRGKKRETCVCAPCEARRWVFGENVAVSVQETMRAELTRLRAIEAKAIEFREAWHDSTDMDCVRLEKAQQELREAVQP